MLKARVFPGDYIYNIDIVDFIDDLAGSFHLGSTQNSQIAIRIPYKLAVDRTYESPDFLCIPFISPNLYKENDIFEVDIIDEWKGRVGYAYPVQALLSTEHSLATNEHFLKFAYVSFLKLLKGEVFETDVIFDIIDYEGEMGLDNIYNSSLIIFCLSKYQIDKRGDFAIDYYLHSLMDYRYLYCRDQRELTIVKDTFPTANTRSRIRLRPVAFVLREEYYIRSLFKDLLIATDDPIVKFHLLYQIIELLINRVYENEIRTIAAYPKLNSKQPHELSRELINLTTEDARIKRLFEKYLSKNLNFRQEVLASSNQILALFSKAKESVEDAVYQVRNLVVHNFRDVTKMDPRYDRLSGFNEWFEKLVIEIITIYQEPDNLYPNASLEWLKYKLQLEG